MKNPTILIDVADRRKDKTRNSCLNFLRNNILPSMSALNVSKAVEVGNGNKFLHAAYQIKKSELFYNYGKASCESGLLLHATAARNIASILKNNLDWRYVRRSKYGIGVSFTHAPQYADKYCTNRNGSERVFIVCEVLTGKMQRVSDNEDSYPKYGAHTYKTYNNMVVVKFDDFTFYPIFVVYYSTDPSSLKSLPVPVITAEPTATRSSTVSKPKPIPVVLKEQRPENIRPKPLPSKLREQRPHSVGVPIYMPSTSYLNESRYPQAQSGYFISSRPHLVSPSRPVSESKLCLKIKLLMFFICACAAFYFFIRWLLKLKL